MAVTFGTLVAVVVPAGPAGASAPVWTIAANPNPGPDSFASVSCVAADNCVAVGSYSNGTAQQSLIEDWNGSTWTQMASPGDSNTNAGLLGVSCISATSCVAVGDFLFGSIDQTVIQTLSGGTWSLTPSPNQSSVSNSLAAVSCTSASFCMAVGSAPNGGSADQTLAEEWNGASWSIVPSPNPKSDDDLSAVSCTGPSFCEAVGQQSGSTLVERWNGSSWSVTSSPNPAGNLSKALLGVSCVSATSCQAVGQSAFETLVESWNGSAWSIVSSPNVAKAVDALEGVSCVSASACGAVGWSASGSGPTPEETLVETWDGSHWTITTSPSIEGSSNYLYGASCTAATNCVAVGHSSSGSVDQALIEGFAPPPPGVSGISPNTGFTMGGTSVTITGTGFTGATAVDFGGVAGTDVVVANDGSLTVTSPPDSSGKTPVTVTTPDGTSSVNAVGQFTYTVEATATVVSCAPNCTDTVSTPLDQTSVAVTGNAGTASGASESLVVNTDTVACGHGAAFPTPISTFSTNGFPSGATVTATETMGNEPTTKGASICYLASGATSGSVLKTCPTQTGPAPCLISLTENSGSVDATFLLPANDPRFWGVGAAVTVKTFSPKKGLPGSKVTVKGKNLSNVTAVVMGGATATIVGQSSSKLVVTVPTQALTGPISVTAGAEPPVVSKASFTVT